MPDVLLAEMIEVSESLSADFAQVSVPFRISFVKSELLILHLLQYCQPHALYPLAIDAIVGPYLLHV